MKYHQLVVMPASVEDWLDRELEVLGIDAVVYTRYILSILQQDNDLLEGQRYLNTRNIKDPSVSKEKSKLKTEQIKLLNCEEMKKSAAVECLLSVSEQKCGIEKLVDELCDKLKNIQGNGTLNNEQGGSAIEMHNITSSHSQEQAENYYSAFPALSTDSTSELTIEKPNLWKNIIGDEGKENNENEDEIKRKKILVGYIECDWLKVGITGNKSPSPWPITLGGSESSNSSNNNSKNDEKEEKEYEDGEMNNINNKKNKAKQQEANDEQNIASPLEHLGDVINEEVIGASFDASDDDQECLGEAELLAKLAAKFNEDVASIWNNEGRDKEVKEEDIWQMTPMYDRQVKREVQERETSDALSNCVDFGREYVWPHFVGDASLLLEDAEKENARCDSMWRGGNALLIPECDDWSCNGKGLYSSFANLEIDCSTPRDHAEPRESTFEASPPLANKDEEMRLIWEILGNLHSDLPRRDQAKLDFLVDGCQRYNKANAIVDDEWQSVKNNTVVIGGGDTAQNEKLVDLQMIWDSPTMQRDVSRLNFISYDSPSENLSSKEMWSTDDGRGASTESLTRSYDSYLNKIYQSEAGSVANEIEAQSEPTMSPKNCTLTYHKGESCFVEVKPSCKWSKWRNETMNVTNLAPRQQQHEVQKENLLTSPKTHFRPIRQESCETDTTTTSSEDSINMEEKKKKISPAKVLMSCCPGEEDEEESSDESSFFSQNCIRTSNKEKFCQTDEMNNPKLTTIGDCRGQTPTAIVDAMEDLLGGDIVMTDFDSSSSVSLPSSREEQITQLGTETISLSNYNHSQCMWDSVAHQVKWSTVHDDDDDDEDEDENDENDADEEKEDDEEDEGDTEEDEEDERMAIGGGMWSGCAVDRSHEEVLDSQTECAESDKVKALRDEIRQEEEKLFEDINFLRVSDLDEGVDDKRSIYSWARNLSDDSAQNSKIICSSSDGDEVACVENVPYSDYFGDLQSVDSFVGCNLPLVPSNKVLYSTDLEEEWKKNDDTTKSRSKSKTLHMKRPCSFYLEGNCRRTDCKFSHDLASITCRFWLEGSCFKGVTCPFLHGFHKDKSDVESKCDFKLELESEAHFPALCKPKDLVQSSSSDSTPITTKAKRQRKRFPVKDQTKGARQKFKRRASKSSSSDDDAVEL